MRLFERLPGMAVVLVTKILDFVGSHPVLALFILAIAGVAAWLGLLSLALRRDQNKIQRSQADRKLPGSFPGDHR